MSDIIEDTAFGQVDIITMGHDGHSTRRDDTVNSCSLDVDYSDEDFLVVDCRTNGGRDLTAKQRTGSCALKHDSKTANTTTTNESRATCSEAKSHLPAPVSKQQDGSRVESASNRDSKTVNTTASSKATYSGSKSSISAPVSIQRESSVIDNAATCDSNTTTTESVSRATCGDSESSKT